MSEENFNTDFENFAVPEHVMQALLGSGVAGKPLTLPARIGAIDNTRPLGEYPTASDIATYLKSNAKPQHIYTKDLNVNGLAVRDSFESYLSNSAHGSSTVKEILTTPMNYAFAISNDAKQLEKLKEKERKDDYFDLGTYLHQCILEPTKFSRVCVKPENAPMNSKDGVNRMTDFWTELIIKNEGGYNEQGEKITPAECCAKADNDVIAMGHTKDKMEGMKIYCKALEVLSGIKAISAVHFAKIQILEHHYKNYANGLIPRLLKHSKREISMYCDDPTTGVPVKIRPDGLQFAENIGVNAIISVKSTGCKDLSGFAYRSAELHYDLSEGMYQEIASHVTGRDFNTTITIMLQTVEPYAVAVLVWSGTDIEVGKHKYFVAMQDIAKCIETGVFKGFDTYAEEDNIGLINFELPQWNNKELLPKS